MGSRLDAGQYGRLLLIGRGAARHADYAERGCAHKEIGEVTARHSRLRIIMDRLGARMTQTGCVAQGGRPTSQYQRADEGFHSDNAKLRRLFHSFMCVRGLD